MSKGIPPKNAKVEDIQEIRRFYVDVPVSAHFAIQKEAFERGLKPNELGGAILEMWLDGGKPESFSPVPSSAGAAHVAHAED